MAVLKKPDKFLLSGSSNSSDEERLKQYREEVKELVGKVIPEELDNLSTMMDQFEGREAELINTLQNMEERTSTQRARAAVHKTKVKVNKAMAMDLVGVFMILNFSLVRLVKSLFFVWIKPRL